MHARRHTKQAAGPRVESQRPKELRHVPGCGGLHSGRPACMERAGPMHAASKLPSPSSGGAASGGGTLC